MGLNFCYDILDERLEPFSDVYPTDFENNISPINHGWAGYDMDETITDNELKSGTKQQKLLYRIHGWLLRPHFDIQFQSLEIMSKSSEKYYYVIDVFPYSFWDDEQAKYPIFPQQVLDDIKSKKAKILVLFVQESLRKTAKNMIDDIFEQWVKTYNLPKRSIVVSSGTYNFQMRDTEHVVYIPFSSWQIAKSYNSVNFKQYFELGYKAIRIKMRRNKTYLCYNRRDHLHRQKLVYTLYKKGLLDCGLVSMGKVRNRSKVIPSEFFDTLPLTFDETNLEQNQAGTYLAKDYLNTYFSVVTETLYKDDLFPTEKIYKPIIMCHPFFVVTTPGFLNLMRNFGYKTFAPWFNETYDEEENLQKRIDKIVKQIRCLSEKSHGYMIGMLEEMSPILMYNFNVYMNDIKKKKFQYILEEELCK